MSPPTPNFLLGSVYGKLGIWLNTFDRKLSANPKTKMCLQTLKLLNLPKIIQEVCGRSKNLTHVLIVV